MLLGISATANVRTFKPLPLCSAPWKLTGRYFWSSRNERKSFSKEKCVLKKWCGVSQKWWMLEQFASHLCSGTGGGSIGQSRFICQVLCTVIHGISALGGLVAKVGSSAKYRGGHCVLVSSPSFVYWYSWYLWVLRGSLAKVGSSAKFCVLVFHGISALVLRGSISQSKFICHCCVY